MSDSILVEPGAPVATVTLNRPERANALGVEAWGRLGRVFAELDNDDEVRCIVVRGAGPGFGAGADISEFPARRASSDQARQYAEVELGGLAAVANCRHPTVAAIHGACAGGGLAVALCCDVRIATRSARFGIPVTRLGLTMAYGELEVVQRVLGPAATADVLLSGEIFDAERALQLGVVTRVVDDSELNAATSKLAARICAGGPLVNRWHKKFIRRLQDPTPLTDADIDEGYACFDTADYRRGVEAFLAKRKPEFEGN